MMPFFSSSCRMQFKHTPGQQDFMSRTENQEQSTEKEGERGKRGNEIAARRARETAEGDE